MSSGDGTVLEMPQKQRLIHANVLVKYKPDCSSFKNRAYLFYGFPIQNRLCSTAQLSKSTSCRTLIFMLRILNIQRYLFSM